MSQENCASICEQIANQTMIFGSPRKRENILAKINAVTIEDIKMLADRVVSSNVSVVTVGKGNTDLIVPALERNGLHVG